MAKIFEIGSGQEIQNDSESEDSWEQWHKQIGDIPLSAGVVVGWTVEGEHLLVRGTEGLSVSDLISMLEMAKHIMLSNSIAGEVEYE